MNTTQSTKKKLLAQALGIAAAAVLGILSNGGTAAADGHDVVDPTATWPGKGSPRGSAQGAQDVGNGLGEDFDPDGTWSCPVGPCWSEGSAWGAQDVGGQRGQDWVAAVNGGDMVTAVHSIDTSTESPHNNLPPNNNLPTTSWPEGWGVDDRG
jgi:hypothetical protein